MCTMSVTNQATLPIPNPHEWCTSAEVERRLGICRQTVHRMAKQGVLTRYPVGGVGGTSLFWVPEVDEVAAARARVRAAYQDYCDA